MTVIFLQRTFTSLVHAHVGLTQLHSPDGKKRGGADAEKLGEPLVMQAVTANINPFNSHSAFAVDI